MALQTLFGATLGSIVVGRLTLFLMKASDIKITTSPISKKFFIHFLFQQKCPRQWQLARTLENNAWNFFLQLKDDSSFFQSLQKPIL